MPTSASVSCALADILLYACEQNRPLKPFAVPQIQWMEKNLSVQNSIALVAGFLLLLWIIRLAETLAGTSLSNLGVYPQSASGLIGVITAPLIHGSWEHLISNTLPVLLLGSMLLYGYPNSRWWVITLVWLCSGLGVWFFARENHHIGASGLAHGLFFFLFGAGILRRDKRSVALLMVAFFMYGTMVWTIFPQAPGISFEYHFFGAVSGLTCAILFRRRDPKPVVKTYQWEQEEPAEEELDPIIGDEWMLPHQRKSVTEDPADPKPANFNSNNTLH